MIFQVCGAQVEPRMAEIRAKLATSLPKLAQVAPNLAKVCPSWPQVDPIWCKVDAKTAPNYSKAILRGPKRHPRREEMQTNLICKFLVIS